MKTKEELQKLANELSDKELLYLISESMRKENVSVLKFKYHDFELREHTVGTIKIKEFGRYF